MKEFTFYLFIPFLAFLLLGINLIFALHKPYQEKSSVFECGFHSFIGQNRIQFNVSFFIFALLFLLFDLEILLVYPYVVSAYSNEIYGLIIMLIFFLILTLGFVFEIGKNALNISPPANVLVSSFLDLPFKKSFGARLNRPFNIFKRSASSVCCATVTVGVGSIYHLMNILFPVCLGGILLILAFDNLGTAGLNAAQVVVDHAEDVRALTATAGPVEVDMLGGIGHGVTNSDINRVNSIGDIDDTGMITFTSPRHVFNYLENLLNNINRLRRVNMSLLRDLHSELRLNAEVLQHNIDYVALHFPAMSQNYLALITNLQGVSDSANNTLTLAAEGMNDNVAHVFEDIQEPLDSLADSVERQLLVLDPQYEAESDTDSEKIADAVEEHASRFPTRRG